MKAESLLEAAHRATGGLGLDIQTFGGDGRVEVRWRRDYDGGVWSDERVISAESIDAALRAVVSWENEQDAEEQAAQDENFG
jgi:hypothetical protein